MTTHKTRRALLFMPGDDRHKIEKGAALDVDSIVMDLEDGVAATHKEQARETVRTALREVNFNRAERLVRINPIFEDGIYMDDLEATIEAHPDGYVLPKVERAGQVRSVDAYLTRAERKYGWLDGSVRLLALIETAKGVTNLRKIARSSPRLTALIFGAEDLAGSIGATRTEDGWEVFYARSAVVLHAKANGMDAIDSPFVNLTAEDSHLIAEAERASYMGYTGKLAIHPKQVAPLQKVFTPTPEQIDSARQLVDAFQTHQEAGEGVFVFDGRMIDAPMVRAAELILARARAAGIAIAGE